MYDTVNCPYCEHENDMSDALCDGLSDDNKLDWTCRNCDEEFEIYVEFDPIYTSSKIIYEKCGECGKETRDIYHDKRVFPFPKKLIGKRICHRCWILAMEEEY